MRFFQVMAIGLTVGGGALLSGCSNQTTVDDLRDANRVQQQRIAELESEVESYGATREALRDQLSRAEARAAEAERLRQATANDLAAARNQYGELEGRLNSLDPVMLPVELDMALERLASANPDLMVYDARRGMVQFLSDLTFDLGSAELKSQANDTLAKLAQVLGSSSATGYDIRVVGHTDNVPIKNVGTRAKHPTNLHLSVHRAISVRDALVRAGVSEGRCSVAGWGEYRPVVANPAAGGARANRRVEIFLVASSQSNPSAPANNTSSDGSGNVAEVPEEPLK